MNDARETKKWKAVEAQLNMASELLANPSLFSLEERSLESYRYDSRETELRDAMLGLEQIAREHGAKTGFWRYIEKVASTIQDAEKVAQYQEEFKKAFKANA